MARLIDADALINRLEMHHEEPGLTHNYKCGVIRSIMITELAPTIDAEPVRHGRWEHGGINNTHRYCSNCKNRHITATPRDYRARCGAKMDLESERVRE